MAGLRVASRTSLPTRCVPPPLVHCRPHARCARHSRTGSPCACVAGACCSASCRRDAAVPTIGFGPPMVGTATFSSTTSPFPTGSIDSAPGTNCQRFKPCPHPRARLRTLALCADDQRHAALRARRRSVTSRSACALRPSRTASSTYLERCVPTLERVPTAPLSVAPYPPTSGTLRRAYNVSGEFACSVRGRMTLLEYC